MVGHLVDQGLSSHICDLTNHHALSFAIKSKLLSFLPFFHNSKKKKFQGEKERELERKKEESRELLLSPMP